MSEKQNNKAIVRKDKKDGTSEYIINGSLTKSLVGKIIIGVLAFSMIAAVIAGLVISILDVAGVFN